MPHCRWFGCNRLCTAERRSGREFPVEWVKSIIVLLVVAAAALSFAFGEAVGGIAVAAVVVVNTLMGFVMELRAVRSMDGV